MNKNKNEQPEENIEGNLNDATDTNTTDTVNENQVPEEELLWSADEADAEPEEELDEYGKLSLQNEKLQQEVGETKDKYVRLFAEFDNFKKRTAKESLELRATAGKKMILDLLPIIDDFERALKTNIDENEADHNEGFGLIHQKLLKMLESKGIVQMQVKGDDFDPEFHEAMTEIDAGEENKGKVVDIIEQGYVMNEKIIRYARVVVGK